MICKATKEDATKIAKLANQMWEDNTVEDLAEEFTEMTESDEAVIFLLAKDEQPIGFAQCQLRHDYVEGTDSSPVGYLEGIFIEPSPEIRAMQNNCWPSAKSGRRKKAAWSLQVIANWTTMPA